MRSVLSVIFLILIAKICYAGGDVFVCANGQASTFYFMLDDRKPVESLQIYKFQGKIMTSHFSEFVFASGRVVLARDGFKNKLGWFQSGVDEMLIKLVDKKGVEHKAHYKNKDTVFIAPYLNLYANSKSDLAFEDVGFDSEFSHIYHCTEDMLSNASVHGVRIEVN